MKLTRLSRAMACLFAGAFASAGCSGLVSPPPPSGGSGSGNGGAPDGSSGGGRGSGTSSGAGSVGGGADSGSSCDDLAVPTIAQICPDGSSVGGTYVSQNGSCVLEFICPPPPNPPPPPAVCTDALPNLCELCPSGEIVCAHYAVVDGECSVEVCPPQTDASPPTGCVQGAACTPNSGCGSGGPDQCAVSCACDATDHLQCTTTCPAMDAGPDVTPSDSGICGPSEVLRYESPGCGVDAHPICGSPFEDACEIAVCGCDGKTITKCDFASEPWASVGPCDDGAVDAHPDSPFCPPLPCPSGRIFDPVQCGCVMAGCTTAADCSGPLPQLCEVCDGGGSGCAHWACVAGQCDLAFCE